jgi:two-component system cell cycle sensor histidine kinase/response regulator CckA
MNSHCPSLLTPPAPIQPPANSAGLGVLLATSPIRVKLAQIIGDSQSVEYAIEWKGLDSQFRLERCALEQIEAAIFVNNPTPSDNPIEYVSPAYKRITGCGSTIIQGQFNWMLNGSNTDPPTISQLGNVTKERGGCSIELLNHCANGNAFWSSLSTTPFHDSTGGVAHFVGVQADIARRRSVEEQLRQSQKMETLGRLAGGIAHDFNNILTVILGNTELVLEEISPCNTQLVDWIREIGDAARRAADLTRQVLIFSRKQAVQTQSLSLNAVIINIHKLLCRIMGEDVSLVTKLQPDLGMIKADSGQLEQILMNLAVNGRDAMPGGGVLTIETANIELDSSRAACIPNVRPGAYVQLTVSDSGIGMAPEVLGRVFEPFFTTKLPGQGTGMGLATVFGIIKQSGGHVAVQSEPAKGTSFQIFLPRTVERTALPDAAEPVVKILRGRESILLIEDEPQVRHLAGQLLRNAGYTVLDAENGSQAILFAQQHLGPINLIVTDVIMPGMNGNEAAKALLKTRPQCKVLYISGYTHETIVKRGVLPKDAELLQKPFTQASLTNKVRELLDRRSVDSKRPRIDCAP